MTDQSGIAQLLAEVKATRSTLEGRDGKFTALETTVNDIMKRLGRPGLDDGNSQPDERKSAAAYLAERHYQRMGNVKLPDFAPADIDAAVTARKGFTAFCRAADFSRLPDFERKALSEFHLGSNGVLVPPEISDKVLSCLTDPGDLTGAVEQLAISSAAIQFLTDNVDGSQLLGWACEASCGFNNPGDATSGLGQLEMKPEELRGMVCATRSFLDDSAVNPENWLIRKAADGIRRVVNQAIAIGTGVGTPQGLLHPSAGVPICEVGANTHAGTITWQDLVMLVFSVPVQWHNGAAFVMNQKTLGMLLSTSDANGRPIIVQDLTAPTKWTLLGFPVYLSEFWPDVAPGSTPLLFGNLRQGYMLVTRKALEMLPDPYSGGVCVLFKFFARIGGGVTCANAMRLLRVR